MFSLLLLSAASACIRTDQEYSHSHLDYSATVLRYLCVFMPTAFSYRKADVRSLTCATIIVRAVRVKARQALTSLHFTSVGSTEKWSLVLPRPGLNSTVATLMDSPARRATPLRVWLLRTWVSRLRSAWPWGLEELLAVRWCGARADSRSERSL